MNTHQTAQPQATSFNPEANNQSHTFSKADLNFAPALTAEQVQEHEKNNHNNVRRRIVMMSMTKSGQELYDSLIKEKDGELIVDLMDQVTDHISYLKACLELAECLETRLLIVANVGLQEIEDEEQKQQVH